MGIFDIFKKMFSRGKAKPASKQIRTKGYGYDREYRARVSYQKIHSWIESRIGKVSDIPAPEQEQKLFTLLNDEKADKRASQTAGLEAYIRSNAWRKMLDQ